VHAALLTIQRRVPPLLEPSAREAFTGLLIRAFRRPSSPLRRSLRDIVTRPQLDRLARDLGFDPAGRPVDLDLLQWIEVFRFVAAAR
jgi:16S rRNA A1518/A1519 N6-dimethyltransferase RsmA/KsgA/DIM1 with predicted DNA glycosylase/AP lyase activity